MAVPVKLDLPAKDFDVNVLTVGLQIIVARVKVSMNQSGFNIIASEAGGPHWTAGMSKDLRGADAKLFNINFRESCTYEQQVILKNI